MEPIRMKALDGTVVVPGERTVAALKRELRGELVVPGSLSYERHRRVWNGSIDRRPAVIAQCLGSADVSAMLRFARDYGLVVAARGGGHNVAGVAVCDGGLVIDLSLLRSVRVDPLSRTARIGAGATVADVGRNTSRHGMATPLGIVSVTGYSGLALHGGLGWQLRKHGLSCDNIQAVQIVTPDAGCIRADASENSDLHWAVRGGGGAFGIVTSFEARTFPAPTAVLLGMPIFSIEHAPSVLRFVRDYMEEAPDELMTLASLWTAPDVGEVPPRHRGAPALFVLSCFTGPADEAAAAIDPIRTCAPALVDYTEVHPWYTLHRLLDEDYPEGRRYYWKSAFVRQLPDRLIDVLVGQTIERPSLSTSIDLWFLGGAFGRFAASDAAFGARDAAALINYAASWEEPEEDGLNIEWTRNALRVIQRFGGDRPYLNFPGHAEEGPDMVRAALGENFQRLAEIKRRVDSYNVLRSSLSVMG
jgi:hypothetical protein